MVFSALSLALGTLAQLGLDVRPVLRRIRDRLVRPVVLELRQEVARLNQEIAGLNIEIARERANGAERFRVLEDRHAELHRLSMMLLEHRLKERAEQLEVLLGEPLAAPGPAALNQAAVASPVVSVVMPVYNRAAGVVQAIASVQAQRFQDWELIVVDDGSTDGTAHALAGYAADPRIRVLRQPHGGAAKARNRAFGAARGSFVAYLDSDNLWYPDFLAVAVAAFCEDPALECGYGALISNDHLPPGQRVLFEPFDRAQLLQANYIDLNTLMHRRHLVETYGSFDETVNRFMDWDLVLRFTEHTPARRLPVVAARYRVLDGQRISTVEPAGPNHFHVRRKWNTPPQLQHPLRVLYVVWQYPQLSETYIETEIGCMLRWGVHVEVWSDAQSASPYAPTVPVHRGPLADAIAAARPDVLHVHWLSVANLYAGALAASNLPTTVRAHGFEVTDGAWQAVLAQPWLRRVYCLPHQLPPDAAKAPVTTLQTAFDTTLFRPRRDKDRRLVVRTSATLPSKDLASFFRVAKLLPQHRFLLAGVTCTHMEAYVQDVRQLWKREGSPGEYMQDVPREELAPMVEQAGIYLHTMALPDEPGGAAVGMPISIVEAMATGAYVLVREGTPLVDYVGDAGSSYRDAEHAAKLIASTLDWSDADWNAAWTRSVDRAFMLHADELVLRPLYLDWCAAVSERASAHGMSPNLSAR